MNKQVLTQKTKEALYYSAIRHPDPNFYADTLYGMSMQELISAEECLQAIIDKMENKRRKYPEYDYPTALLTMGTDELANIKSDFTNVKNSKRLGLGNPKLQQYQYQYTGSCNSCVKCPNCGFKF